MTAITAARATVQPPDIEAELAQADPALGRINSPSDREDRAAAD
jgi:hypothetical protein